MRNAGRATLRASTVAIWVIVAAVVACACALSPNPARAASRKAGAPLSLVHGKSRAPGSRRPGRGSRRGHRVSRASRHKAAAHEPKQRAQIEAPAAPEPQAQQPDAHEGVVTLAAGEAEGTDARVASDIVAALAAKGVKVMPVLTSDALGTLHDLSGSPMVDLALTRSDVLDQFKSNDPGADKRIGYVARLFDEEICVLATPGISDIRQLDGKKVGIDVAGSSNAVTGRNLFGRLQLHPQFVETDAATALSQLDKGELDAVVVVDGKPAPVLFAPRAEGVHVVPIPYDAALQDQYYPSRLTHADYPRLIPDATVDTIAVATVLVAPMDGENSSRNDRIASFARAFLTDFDALLAPGRHPKWKDVNLAADAPGWTRIPAAKQWLDSAETDGERPFYAFAAPRSAPAAVQASMGDRDKLFQEFMKWNSTQAR